MKIKVEIKLTDGRTNYSDSDCEVPQVSKWHPSKYALSDALALAADLIGGLDDDGNRLHDASELNIEAVTDFIPTDKWSCQFVGKLIQNGAQIGIFEASTWYKFDNL